MIKLPEWIKNIETSPKIQVDIYNKKNTLDELRFYFKAIWSRVVNWKSYPRDYINIYESQGGFTLFHF